MYNKILDFVESKLEGFERPEVKYDVEFKYGVDSRYIYVPIKDECSIEHKVWWKKFMLGYLEDEYDLYLSICDIYVFSFLHELGHFITLEGIEPQLINDNYNSSLMKLDKIDDKYQFIKNIQDDISSFGQNGSKMLENDLIDIADID